MKRRKRDTMCCMRTFLISSSVASTSLVAVAVVSVAVLSSGNPEPASVAPSVQCTIAAAAYSACVNAKYGVCKGKTGADLVTCMKTASKTGTPCNPSGLTVCLSASCQAAVTALQQCIQRVKTACAGKTGADLEACIKQTKATGCDPGPVQACIAEMKGVASSQSFKSKSGDAAKSVSSSSASASSTKSKKPWWKIW